MNTNSAFARRASSAATAFSAIFLLLLALMHALAPEFDPRWRLISEYAIGPYGALMVLAFFCWGASIFSLLLALWSALRGTSAHVVHGWFVLLTAALFGAGIFTTSPLTDPRPTLTHKLHQLCGTLVIFTFPIAASLVVRSLGKNAAWSALHERLRRSQWIPWLGMLLFFFSLIGFRLLNPHAPRTGPHMQVGIPNRLMVLAYHLWLQLLAAYVRQTSVLITE